MKSIHEYSKETLTQANGEQSKEEETLRIVHVEVVRRRSLNQLSRTVSTRPRVWLRWQASEGCRGPAQVDSVVSVLRRAGAEVARVEAEGRRLQWVSESRTCDCPPSASRRCRTARRARGRVRTDARATAHHICEYPVSWALARRCEKMSASERLLWVERLWSSWKIYACSIEVELRDGLT